MMHGYGFGFGGMLMGAVFWILIIVGVVLLVKWLLDQERTRASSGGESAVEILEKRYARGEIDEEEFEEREGTLSEG